MPPKEVSMPRTLAVFLSIFSVLIIIAVIGGIKYVQIGHMIESDESFSQPPQSVSVAIVEQQNWPNTLTAVGSLGAWQGITVSAEVDGRISAIHFESGQQVKAGDLLIEQVSGNEKAQLRAALSRLALAKSNLQRVESLRKQQSVSQSAIDEASQEVEFTESEVENLKITLSKKNILAPFDGRLGIRQVDLGQELQAGTAIVTLQSIDQLRVNFRVPQQWIDKMQPGYTVVVGTSLTQVRNGVIIARAAEVDSASRNLHVQAKIDNPEQQFLPGMSVGILINLPDTSDVLVIPNTAVLYAPYGDTVFVIEASENAKFAQVRQQFVKLGATRGDFVAIEAGLEKGQRVVSAGAFKLSNSMPVVINENAVPERSLQPTPKDS